MQPDEIELPKITSLAKIGTGKPNDWGLFNMYDNVSEWTASNFVTNLDSMFNTSSKYIILPPGVEKQPNNQNIEYVLPSGQKMERKLISAKDYLQSELEPTQKIVKGNNYKDLIPDGLKNLDYNQSYDYVGFRYVRSYMGIQDK